MSAARRTRLIVAAVVAAVAVAVSLGAYFGHVFRSVEWSTVDVRFDVRGAQVPSDVAVVAVDDATLKALGDWPLPRCDHARVIDRIAKAHPRAIAVDIQFTEQT